MLQINPMYLPMPTAAMLLYNKLMEQQFQLGPKQEKWLQYLEQHPEQQIINTLGRKRNGVIGLCCLSAACVILDKGVWEDVPNEGSWLIDQGEADTLSSYKEIGLRTAKGGAADKPVYKGHWSLADANDAGMPWPQMAAAIRANPSNFFTHSV